MSDGKWQVVGRFPILTSTDGTPVLRLFGTMEDGRIDWANVKVLADDEQPKPADGDAVPWFFPKQADNEGGR